MSEPLRIALVAEGPTDKIVIGAAIGYLLGSRPFILRQLQPEESLAFNLLSGGWRGVYHWCRQAVGRSGGAIRHDPLFVTFDLLILHLDADVAGGCYADAGIVEQINDLPCAQPCPPPSHTTDALRAVLLRWVGEPDVPPKTILCTPSKNIEAWVLSSLYPRDPVVISGNLECYPTPKLQLQAKPAQGRLVASEKKIRRMYSQRAPEVSAAWPQVRARCTEAERFSLEFEARVQPA